MKCPSNLYGTPIPQLFLPSRFFMTFGPLFGDNRVYKRPPLEMYHVIRSEAR
jgi:hypothetical protein